MITGW